MAIFLGLLLPLLVFLLYLLRQLAQIGADPSELLKGGLYAGIGDCIALISCAGILFLVGMVDDWRGLTPLPRFLIELAAAAFLVLDSSNFRLALVTDNAPLAGILSVLWIVAMTNAYNFLDNMDGLTAGMGALTMLILAGLALASGFLAAAALCAALAGALIGFLLFNFPPASIFMGDAGGLFLGFMTGGTSLLLSHHAVESSLSLPRSLAPLFVLAIPAYDLVSVIGIRLRLGAPVWIGDNNHISHRLVGAGMSRKQAVVAIYLLTLLTGLPALFLLNTSPPTGWILLALVPAFMIVMASIELRWQAGRNR